ncbi:hypothetical protein WHI96_19225 [Pseudonocardia tropica]|uniref:Lipoprotein n=1 Tax=Pseudonocardia tropica TaxID=681289 RepID=A0ABV1JYC2_9PSEU
MRTLPHLAAAAALLLALAGCSSSMPAPTADQVVADLTSKISSVQPGEVVTAENDPNKLLGRPNGYTSAMAFTDSRVPTDPFPPAPGSIEAGGKVEVFESEDTAQARVEYIQQVTKGAPMLGEYIYRSGPVVVRVASGLTPDQAADFESALG